jgi:hypothetical protein
VKDTEASETAAEKPSRSFLEEAMRGPHESLRLETRPQSYTLSDLSPLAESI